MLLLQLHLRLLKVDADNVAPALVIDETNNYVGIGDFRTVMPQAMLTVSGDASITGELRVNRSGLFVKGSATENALVGINTTTPVMK